jgi:hypothetical protein
MNSETTTWLNSIGAGTFICICITLFLFVSFLYKKYKSYKDALKEKIATEINDENKMTDLIKSVNELVPKIEGLATTVQRISDDFESYVDRSEKRFEEIEQKDGLMKDLLDIITHSSETDIRSDIIDAYQKWMPLGYIDVYTMSVLEDKYDIYDKHLHANHFAHDMMIGLRTLQTKPVITTDGGGDPIPYFILHPEDHPAVRQENYQNELENGKPYRLGASHEKITSE